MADNLAENELNPSQESNEIINNEETTTKQEEVVTEQVEIKVEESSESKIETLPTENISAPEQMENTTSEAIKVEEVTNDENKKAKESSSKPKEFINPKFDAIFEKLKAVKENNEIIEVSVKERIKGGLRCFYEEMPLFLPASHFALKRNPTEQSMQESIGKKIEVHIHELQEDVTKRKTVIVSRKQILEDKYWESLKVGETIEGPITSIASFGIFIDVYGVEGLVHVSRLSNKRVEDLQQTFKKGQIVKAVIVEVNKENKRIGLSTKELEESPWKGIASEFQSGSVVKGIVRRITDFGAYVEIKPGVDGLCRTSEISWTMRVKNPKEVFSPDQEMEFAVIASNENKKTIALSLKRLSENPWTALAEKYLPKTVVNGTIKYLMDQGAVININGEVDGFMPRSKMRFLPKGLNNPGDNIEVIIDNIDIEKESLIVVPANEEKPQFKPKEKQKTENAGQHYHKDNANIPSTSSDSVTFTLQDLLSDAMKENLLKN